MNRETKDPVSAILKALYPDQLTRTGALRELTRYGNATHHPEVDRVRMAILYLAKSDVDLLKRWVNIACGDYRDVLQAAEYPYSSKAWKLRKENPAEYARLQQKESAELTVWLQSLSDS